MTASTHVCAHCGRAAPTKHEVFFIDTIEFSVENTLFKVPRPPFDAHLQSFSMMVVTSSGVSLGSEASPEAMATMIQDHDGPFRLAGEVTAEEFEAFLSKFIPKLDIGALFARLLPSMSRSTTHSREWISVLKLSTMWRFEKLRNNAIDVLSKADLDPFEYIELGKRFMIPQWPIMGYRRLIEQSLPSEKDAARLGLSSFYHLMTVRDEASRSMSRKKGMRTSASSAFDYDSRISTLIAKGRLRDPENPEPSLGTTNDQDISEPCDPQRSKKHYVDTATFLAGNTLFRVPRKRLEENGESPFATMFSLPSGNVGAEGETATNPIKLPPDVKDTDFANFFEVLYPEYVSSPSLTPSMCEAWTSVLRLATQWQFDNVRKKAIDVLGDQEKDVIRKITLGRQYSISSWLIAAYVELANRDDSDSLKAEEEKVLGDATVVKLLKIEAERRKVERDGADFDLTEKVKEVFKDELMADEEYRHTISATAAASPSEPASDV